MFEQIETYSGSLVDEAGQVSAAKTGSKEPGRALTADEILEAARAEAADILETAQAEAEQLRQAAQAEADAIAEKRILENAIAAARHLRLDVLSSKSGLVKVVEASLESVIGTIGDGTACLKAVEHASREYLDEHRLTLHVNRIVADRLNLLAMGAGKSLKDFGLTVVLDPALGDERCVLETSNGKVEVGLTAQLETFKKLFSEELVASALSAERQVERTGRVA